MQTLIYLDLQGQQNTTPSLTGFEKRYFVTQFNISPKSKECQEREQVPRQKTKKFLIYDEKQRFVNRQIYDTLKGGGQRLVYDNVKRMCEKRKISIAVLEKECGIANGTIGKWNLRKSSPSVATVQKIADYFGVTVGYLLK